MLLTEIFQGFLYLIKGQFKVGVINVQAGCLNPVAILVTGEIGDGVGTQSVLRNLFFDQTDYLDFRQIITVAHVYREKQQQ